MMTNIHLKSSLDLYGRLNLLFDDSITAAAVGSSIYHRNSHKVIGVLKLELSLCFTPAH